MSVLRRAYVEVEPDVSNFDTTLKAKIQAQDPGGKAGKQIGGQLNRALKRFDLAPIDVKADPKSALAGIAVAEARLRELSGQAATVEVKVQTEKALGQLARFRKQIGDVAGDAGPEAASGFAARFGARLGPLLTSLPVSGPMGVALGGAVIAAAPLIGAAVSGAIIGGVGIGGVVGGLSVAAKDPRVKAAAGDLADGLKVRLFRAGGAFVQPALDGIAEIGRALNTVDIDAIFRDSARLVPGLTAGISSAIKDLGDGIESLVHNAGPVVDVIGQGIAAIGSSIGSGLKSLSDNGPEAADALKTVFGLVSSAITSTFRLVNILTELYGVVRKFGLDTGFRLLLKATGAELDNVSESGRRTTAGTFELKGSIDAAAGAARGELAAMVGLSKELRGQTDPAFALINAQDALKKAQDAAAEATRKHGRNSTEARAATRQLALAALDLQGKAGALAQGFNGTLTPAMRATYKAAGLTEAQINDVERELGQARGAADKYAGNYKANVILAGAAGVFTSLDKLLIRQQALNKGISISAAGSAFRKNAGYHDGGWTGPGSKMQEAGVVHADEFVIKKESRRKIERRNPGLLSEMNATGQLRGYAAGGQVWPYPTNVSGTRVPSPAEALSKVAPSFSRDWPSSPGAQRGDSGVWRQVLRLIKSGPKSGSFGNAYRPGDPKWHGSGRAVDWMGFNQDPLARFLAAKRPLELIHRTKQRDYAYTRGRNKGSFNNSLMEAHRNHIHIAMDDGGFRMLQPGMNLIPNGTGRPEPIAGPAAMASLGGGVHIHIHNSVIASKRQAEDLIVEAYRAAKDKRRI